MRRNPVEGGGIVVDELSRDYRARRGQPRVALDRVSLDVSEGTILGLLGPNGAGKTTLARVLTTLLVPSAGRASVAGYDVVADAREVRRKCGVSFGGDLGVYPRLSARDNLRYFATLYKLSRADTERRVNELLERLGLGTRAGDRVETFSRGMKQRLHLARALLHDPPVIILDEPSSGLDPSGARELRELVRELTYEGRTLLLTTHDLREAEELCEDVAILVAGRVLRRGAPTALREAAVARLGTCVEVAGADVGLPDDLIASLPHVLEWRREGDRITIYTHDPGALVSLLLEEFEGQEPQLRITPPSLEAAYLEALVEA